MIHFVGSLFFGPYQVKAGEVQARLAWHIVACDADVVLEDSCTDFLNQRVRWRWTQLWSLDPFEWYLSTKCCYWQTESSFLPMENNQLLGSVPDRLAMWVSVAEQSVRGIFADTAVRLNPGSHALGIYRRMDAGTTEEETKWQEHWTFCWAIPSLQLIDHLGHAKP